MEKMLVGKSVLSNIHHVGTIVRDVDKTAEYYESLGMGPFEPLDVIGEDERIKGKLIYDLKLKIRMGHIGPIRMELIEPVTGTGSIWKEVLESKGEGIHHLAFGVDDIEKAKAELIEKGLNLIFSAKFKNGGGCGYFETDRVGHLVFELFQPPRG
jgi:catechol 2,3-dioxygenase-like lactoylglutathione lyase family enzyme